MKTPGAPPPRSANEKLQKELTTQAYKLVQPNKTITDICDDFLRLWSLAKHSTMPFSFHDFPVRPSFLAARSRKNRYSNWLIL